MKRIITAVVLLSMSQAILAQARTTTVEYQKMMRQGVVAELPFPEKTVSNAIEDKMGKMGYKGKSSKGFVVYSGVRLPELGPDSYDLYYMIDRVSRRDKGSSSVTMLISKGYDNFVTDSADAVLLNNGKNHLNSLREVVNAYDLELQITEQEDVVKKADKKYNGLVDDGTDLQKKKRKLEEQIVENTNAQAAQKQEGEKQRQVLETLRQKRKQ